MESRQVTDLEVKATKVNLQYETPDRREKSRKDSPFDPFQVPPLYTLYPSMPMIAFYHQSFYQFEKRKENERNLAEGNEIIAQKGNQTCRRKEIARKETKCADWNV
jgi:hypothetical protein